MSSKSNTMPSDPPPADARRMPLFGPTAQALLRPRPAIRPSQWAEANRWVYESAIQGPWRNANAPYLRGVMDIPTRPGCVEVNIKKAARVGASEALRNVIGYWADYEPDPVGLTLPDRATGRKTVRRELLPMFRQTACLRRLMADPARDADSETVNLLNGFHLDLMWAGSPMSTAGRNFRAVGNDEVDKMVIWAGREADPIGRTSSRTLSYRERRLVWNQSTPTTDLGAIHGLFENSPLKLFYHVPCPRCGQFQRMAFSALRWEKYAGDLHPPANKAELAARIVREKAAWFECASCHGRIDEADKPAFVACGRWSSADGVVVDADGVCHDDAEAVERWPAGTRIGMHVQPFYCLWIDWPELASRFLRAEGDLVASYEFRTEGLGDIWEFRVRRNARSVFAAKAERATCPEGRIPPWAGVLLAGIDTQADRFYAVVRAFGHGYRSQRVWCGEVLDFAALDRLLFGRQWPFERGGGSLPIALALIDSGGTEGYWLEQTRTRQVYDYCLPRQPKLLAIKGSSRPQAQLYVRARTPSPAAADRRKMPEGLQLWLVDSHQGNDVLADWLEQGLPIEAVAANAPELWTLNVCDDTAREALYQSHLSAMEKVADPIDRRSRAAPLGRWKPIHGGGRFDYRMCEVYLAIAAYMAGVGHLPPEEDLLRMRTAATAATEAGRTQQAPAPTADPWSVQPL